MKKFLIGVVAFVMPSLYANPSIMTLDAENRVKYVSSRSVCTSFEYDEWNNISCEQIGNTKIAYQYSDRGELTSIGDVKFEYDNLGRLIKKEGFDIDCNAYNMMSKFGFATYFYDPASGLRAGKIVGGKEVQFTLDDLGRVTEERDAYGSLISSIEWVENLPYIYRYGDKIYRYKCNAHGDVVALLDESGQTVNSYSYDIFGKSLRTEERIPNPIRYAHEYFDGESGMYYLRGRYYDPSMRRFTTPDPAEDGINH